MAARSQQEEFAHAVSLGKADVWRRLLLDKSQDERFPLDVDLCLLDAVRLQSPAAVRDVLTLKPSLHAEDAEGQRAIHIAARLGPAENVMLLAQAGSTLSCMNAEGLSPLHIACQHDNLATAQALILKGSNKNAARTNHMLTPLHMAVMKGNKSVVELLLENKADPNTKSSRSHGELTALAMAILKGDLSVMEVLLSSGSRLEYTCDGRGSYPLHLAVESGSVDILNLLLANLMQMTPPGRKAGFGTFLAWARVNLSDDRQPGDRAGMVMLNLADHEGQTALHLAIRRGQLHMVRLLLEAGVDVNIPFKDLLPLHLAIRCVQPRDSSLAEPLAMDCAERCRRVAEGAEWDDALVKLLCEHCINVDSMTPSGQRPVHLALSAGLYSVALLLCSTAPDSSYVDCADAAGTTPLHLACMHSKQGTHTVSRPTQLQVICKLLEMGASVNARTNNRGSSPLSFAILNDDLEVVSLLLDHRADLTAVDIDGMSALHDAVIAQSVTIMEALIAAGADVNLCDANTGQTPLILAATEGGVAAAECLLNHNADLNYRESRMGFTALHRAINNFYRKPSQYLQMMELLVRGGADLGLTDRATLTPLQMLLSMVVCRSGEQPVVEQALPAIKLLVEAGSHLQPWTGVTEGVLRWPPLMSLAYNGLFHIVYYLANIGWPLNTEASSSAVAVHHGVGRHPDWLHLPGKTELQNELQAYCLLRHANPFSLRHLCRAAVRQTLRESVKAATAGQELEILTSIEKLPLPDMMRTYLSFRDSDYSDVELCWGQLAHLLPPGALDSVLGRGADATSSPVM